MSALHDPRAGLTATQIDGIRNLTAARARMAAAAKDAPMLPAPKPAKPTVVAMSRHADLNGSPLDPRLTFDTFVQGHANVLAHAAARQVAEGRRGDPVMFNPLYIHAGVGRGKTHLLQAITWAGNTSPDRKVVYLSAEKFMYGFMEAMKNRSAYSFREALRAVDVLVIDDLQFLAGKTVRNDLCNVIDAVIDAGRQVVLAADRGPGELEGLDPRTSSRLAAGLVVEIGASCQPQRREILQQRVAAARDHHASFDVDAGILDYLAETLTGSGRDLEAVINRLLAASKLNNQSVTMDLAVAAARDLISPIEPKKIRIEDIQRETARHFNVTRGDLISARRTANVVKPRQLAMYLSKTLTLRSLPDIGRRFGGRDHTTALHAVRKIEALIPKDPDLRAAAEHLTRQLKGDI